MALSAAQGAVSVKGKHEKILDGPLRYLCIYALSSVKTDQLQGLNENSLLVSGLMNGDSSFRRVRKICFRLSRNANDYYRK